MVPYNWIPSAECRDTGEQIQAVQREIRPVFIPAPDFRKWEILKHRCPQGDGSNLLISCLSTREGWGRRKASWTKLKCGEANRDVFSSHLRNQPDREELLIKSVRKGTQLKALGVEWQTVPLQGLLFGHPLSIILGWPRFARKFI